MNSNTMKLQKTTAHCERIGQETSFGIARLCNTLHHTATHCNTLQHTATHAWHCKTLQHTASYCNTVAKYCRTLQHPATQCDHIGRRPYLTLQHTATHCNTLHHTVAILARGIILQHTCKILQHTPQHSVSILAGDLI